MKVALRILVVVAIGLLLVFGAVLLFAGRAARLAVEKGGTYALGVPTTLESASISPLRGEVALEGLAIANPPGFDKPRFVALDHATLDVKTSTLLTDKIEATELLIDGFALTLERKDGKANYDVILDNLKKLKKKDGKPSGEPGEGGKKFVIRTVVLRNLVAEVYLLPIGGPTTVKVPEVVLHNVGEDGESMDAAIATIVQAALQAIVNSAGGLLPPDLLKDLSGGLAGLGKGALQIGEQAGKALEKVGEKAGDLLEGAGKDLSEILKKKN